MLSDVPRVELDPAFLSLAEVQTLLGLVDREASAPHHFDLRTRSELKVMVVSCGLAVCNVPGKMSRPLHLRSRSCLMCRAGSGSSWMSGSIPELRVKYLRPDDVAEDALLARSTLQDLRLSPAASAPCTLLHAPAVG